ncbi:BEM_collapsed_G0052660.mRNA.1.CDS.1 [Saccharomyces cerevisiae]|nr:BEM_HP_G0010760.mRNA.1.CDS.1 [Saccharomyces cerevisiae]CAI5075632.1 BEM_HP_G0054640.mRNA.1.CDS.1 [Saccharomyces cerevisiae]CAI5206869.1 BEM_HP_G0109010.mRNA.1.CDS.1 [Saccharomyces cerevisiae]CAI6896356.1 BEM_HP_G0010760.mRNA.1.CDS.1 [Saccharomyces cerevisiae]CAI6966099.1 BEM_HP_G0054640.mRNA.1.CDS.1 [Saccharomyces cerevisiae]
MARSYTFVINIALESIYRAVLEKVIKYRTEVENTCLQQLQDELNGSYSLTDNVNTPIDPSLSDLGVTSASPLAGNSPGLPPEEVRNNSENASHNNETGPIETELAQTISNEFWTAYNLGWEELMSQPDYKYLFDTQ